MGVMGQKTVKRKKKKAGGKSEEKLLNEILGILVITIAVLSGVALFVGPEASTLYDIKQIYMKVFGYTALIVPSLIGLLGMFFIWRRKVLLSISLHLILTGLLFGAFINWGVMVSTGGGFLSEMDYMHGGGAVSAFIVSGLAHAVTKAGVFMLLLATALIYAKIALKISYKQLFLKVEPYLAAFGKSVGKMVSASALRIKTDIQKNIETRKAKMEAAKSARERELEEKAKKLMEEEAARTKTFAGGSVGDHTSSAAESYMAAEIASDDDENTIEGIAKKSKLRKQKKIASEGAELIEIVPDPVEESAEVKTEAPSVSDPGSFIWNLPTADDWLEDAPRSTESQMDNSMREKLEKTLQSFEVPAKVTNVLKGAAFTRFELELEPGTKVARIVSLENDMALSLATDSKSIRIEAPIPGKSAIGIEVPNKERATVPMRSIFLDPEFQRSKKPLTFILGEDIVGKPVFTNLVKMPHLLVAGSTNSGKSVCLNCIITSFLAREFPTEVRFIMIDMKRVELTPYDGIPHLLTPVIKEAGEAANALRWVCEEMDKRYKKFSEIGVRDIDGHNKFVETPEEKMHRIVVIIDELADLMMVSSSNMNIENYICRITQLARATGIHVILATQRPDTKVITGTIKNNIPSRISFAVASQIDSRTILDRKGAEALLGRGDMLFMPIDSPRMMRLQGTFVSDEEVRKLVKFWKDQGLVEYNIKFSVAGGVGGGGVGGDAFSSEDEALYKQAVEIVVNTGQASISMLQRRLRIGYNRAARLVDLMEERHVVGPYDGVHPREVMVTPAGLDEI